MSWGWRGQSRRQLNHTRQVESNFEYVARSWTICRNCPPHRFESILVFLDIQPDLKLYSWISLRSLAGIGHFSIYKKLQNLILLKFVTLAIMQAAKHWII